MNDRSALTDELKSGEDNSDPIKVHPELNCVTSSRPCVCVLGTEHANAPNIYPIIYKDCISVLRYNGWMRFLMTVPRIILAK